MTGVTLTTAMMSESGWNRTRGRRKGWSTVTVTIVGKVRKLCDGFTTTPIDEVINQGFPSVFGGGGESPL